MFSDTDLRNLHSAVKDSLEHWKKKWWAGNGGADVVPALESLLQKVDSLEAYEKVRDEREKALATAIRTLMSAEGGEPGDTDEQKEAWEEAVTALCNYDTYQHCRRYSGGYRCSDGTRFIR